jgi:hypothetical protein
MLTLVLIETLASLSYFIFNMIHARLSVSSSMESNFKNGGFVPKYIFSNLILFCVREMKQTCPPVRQFLNFGHQ